MIGHGKGSTSNDHGLTSVPAIILDTATAMGRLAGYSLRGLLIIHALPRLFSCNSDWVMLFSFARLRGPQRRPYRITLLSHVSIVVARRILSGRSSLIISYILSNRRLLAVILMDITKIKALSKYYDLTMFQYGLEVVIAVS